MSSVGKIVKQAARIQRQIEEKQQALAARTVEATSGGGAVKAVAKCDISLVSLKIDPAAVNPADVALLEDLVLTAVNGALAQARAIQEKELGEATGGFSLPGLF